MPSDALLILFILKLLSRHRRFGGIAGIGKVIFAWMSILLWLVLPFYDFAVFNLSPLTECINCSFFTLIFAVLLSVLSRHISSFSTWLQRFLKKTAQGWGIKCVYTYVRKVMLSSCVSLFFCLSRLGFLKSRNFILTDGMQRAKMHQRAIFRQNRSNAFWDHNFLICQDSRWWWPPCWK